MIESAPSAGAAQASPDAAAQELTGLTSAEGLTGTVGCRNNTNRTIAFRAVVTCGWSRNEYGEWKTLTPGATDTSKATCAYWSSGVGSVTWEET
ncbi:hypothetical protein FE633_18415 [Streptomyces montanus]|uniref:Uncharacterized protein n=1 Tax=Streptomyces montanus TaxID=2580423 RepID=A0A5R9FZJ2_9ACTN|nr:hypothetical protein [Streptomyces montanus]TLS44805.1 hypothetical protein FE633_18415 [Streptomyces montanus]